MSAADPLALSVALLGEAKALGGTARARRIRELAAALDRIWTRPSVERRRGPDRLLAQPLQRAAPRRRCDTPARGTLLRHRRLFRRAGLPVGAQRYALDVIEHGVSARQPAAAVCAAPAVLRGGDPRLAAAPSRLDPRIHFALNCGARSVRRSAPTRRTARRCSCGLATCSYLEAEATIDARGGEP